MILLAFLACMDEREAEAPTSDVVALRVEPALETVTVSQGEPATVPFLAWATFDDGHQGPIDLVSWSSSNLSVGSIDPSGVFTSVDTNGGVTEIAAAHLGIEALATLTIIYQEDVFAEGADADLAAAFAGAEATPSEDVDITYPFDGVTVPRNLEGLSFFWEAPDAANVARLRLQSEITDVSVYLAGDSWTATAELWSRVAAANREGQVEVKVEVGTWEGGALTNVLGSAPIELTVNRLDARGSVLYWETASESIMRIPFGTTEVQEFWTSEDSRGHCTGCHVVNDATDVMVVSHDGVDGRFTVVDIADPDGPYIKVEPNDANRTSFKSVSPDGRYMISTDNGMVSLFEVATGARVRDYELDGYYVQPDWSPDGSTILLVRPTRGLMSDFIFEGADIVVVPFADGDLGEPEVILPADPTWNYYYPAWSPDGEWVAFNRTLGSGYASIDAEVFLMRPDGSEMRRLDLANGDSHQKNSYPRWGPLPDDDVLWLAFSSLRSCPECGEGLPQIWVTAIDMEEAAKGGDPSSAPFRLPGQSASSDNHLPYWWKK